MARRLQLRRGTASQNTGFTGYSGELSYDTENHNIRVHDGSTAGGYLIDNSTAVVHKTGNATETIDGQKRFTGNIIRKFTNITRGTIPSNTTYGYIYFSDSADVELGGCRYSISVNNGVFNEASYIIYLDDFVNNSNTTKATISLKQNANNLGYIVYSANQHNFYGDIYIEDADPFMRFKSTTMDITQNGWTSGSSLIRFVDKNGNRSGAVKNANTSSNVETQLYAFSKKTGSEVSAVIVVGIDENGSGYCKLPIHDGTIRAKTTTGFRQISKNQDYTASPSSYVENYMIEEVDIENRSFAQIKTRIESTRNSMYFPVRAKDGTWKTGFAYHVEGTGSNLKAYATIDTPALSDNSTKIATTNWVKSFAMGKPNWDAIQGIGNDFVAPQDGYVFGYMWNGDQRLELRINGYLVGGCSTAHGGTSRSGLTVVRTGDVVNFVHNNSCVRYFVPCMYV